MAIATIDALVAGLRPPLAFHKTSSGTGEAAGIWHSLALLPGYPAAMVAPATGLNGAQLGKALVGAMPFEDAGAAPEEVRLAGLDVVASRFGSYALYDRLWHNSGIAVATTTAQAITHPGIPARSRDGTANGDGVHAAMECYTATTNAAIVSNTTISYTNEAGVAGRTGSLAQGGWPATAVAGTFVPFNLQAGDKGIRSIQSVTLGTSYGGGAVGLVMYRDLARMPISSVWTPSAKDAIALGMPKLYNDSSLFWRFFLDATTVPTLFGSIVFAIG